MRRIAICLAVLVAAVACAAGDSVAPPTTTAVATTTSAATTTTTEPPTPTTRPAMIYKEALEILDYGAQDRTVLRYASNKVPTPFHVEVTDIYNASHWAPEGRTTEGFATGQSVPIEDGLRLEIASGGLVDSGGGKYHSRDLTLPADGMRIDLTADGGLLLPDGASDREDPGAAALREFLRDYLIPLPDEPIGIGARWSYPRAAYGYDSLSKDYELVAVNGPIVTLRAVGSSGGYDGDRHTGNQVEIDHSGVFTLDLSSGRFAGEVSDVGTVAQSTTGVTEEGTEQRFERHTLLDIPARFTPSVTETRTIDVAYAAVTDGRDDGVDVRWAGATDIQEDGNGRFTGTAHPIPELEGESTEFEIYVLPDGSTAFGSTAGLPSPTIVFDTLPDFTEGAMLHDDDAIRPLGDMWMSISLGGFRAPFLWAVESIEGSRMTIVGNGDINKEFITRGAYNLIVGRIEGRFEVDLFDPFATTGSIGFSGTYNFSEFGQVGYHEGWTLTTPHADGAVDSADG